MPPQDDFIKYVPAQEGAQPKIIRMVEAQKDPLEPPRFRLNQKVPPPPPSPPAPVMHSPPRKITAEEHKQWKIPPCVSSWKNPRGYTISLDKRCAFSGRTMTQPEIVNPKFAQMSESLSIAKRQNREALEERAKAEKLMAEKEKERNEEKLRLLAQQAREERATFQRGLGPGRDDDEDEGGAIDKEEVMERMRIRDERHRERVRNVNIKASAPDKRTKLDRQRERDISEQIALGVARPNTIDQDVHDQRLYNQSQGLSSGFGDEDDYAVYDKAWKSKASFSTNYRPSESVMQDSRDQQREESTDKAVTSGNDNDPLAPIQFEKDVEDVFNVESLLRNARHQANARKLHEASNSRGSSSKRRRDS